MSDRPPTSVLLPATRWTDACAELASQLGDSDELLVIHDGEDDPECCSGKANAIAAGMEAVCHDRLVWTDDDFHLTLDWLATLSADYEDHGPVSEVPQFVGRDPLSVALEPLYASMASPHCYCRERRYAEGSHTRANTKMGREWRGISGNTGGGNELLK